MNGNRSYLRFSVPDRIEHWLLMLSFTTLAVTGLAQKFSSGWFAEWIIRTLGGIETVRVIHRVAAVVMILEAIYHLGVVGYRVFVLRGRLTMLPGVEDLRVAMHAVMYNLGLREDRPQQGRFTFEEKAEYWALIWGTVIMTITGFMLWNPIAATSLLPGEIIPAAKAAHGAEALLAVLAIIVWHFYGVHLKVFNRGMFTGRLTEKEMDEEHPLELARIKAGVAERPVDPAALNRRRQGFFTVFGVAATAMLLGVYVFVTFEETAINTVPPIEQAAVFAPLTPTPFPTPLPTSTPPPSPTPPPTPEPGEPTTAPAVSVTWGDVADLFQSKCGACHSEANALSGLNLASYEAALAGGNSGSVIEPGDPDASALVTLQAQGGHPGQFSGDELAQIRQWIEDGALEAPQALPEAPPAGAEAGVTWGDLADLFQTKCGTCHGSATKLGDLDLSSYEAALAVVQPGDPDASLLVTLQEQGGHPGQLSADELTQVRQWIEGGALER